LRLLARRNFTQQTYGSNAITAEAKHRQALVP